ncbi:MAG: HlyD family type I secretion periplasmic adaptor subunit [Neomegalonema sp.]|nr:HlyD family type I secretion periplasmic adaptor subunit [Neomegalonema sp.]
MATPPALARRGGQPSAAPTSKRWSARPYMLVGLTIVAILFFGVGVWGSVAELAGAVIAPAELQVENKRRTVQHLEGGVVEAIRVREGDRVEAGDVLMVLDKTAIASNVEIVDAQLDELLARQARLEAERIGAQQVVPSEDLAARTRERPSARRILEGQVSLFNARRETLKGQLEQLDGRITQTSDEIAGAEAQIVAMDQQLGYIKEELDDKLVLLAKGGTTKPQVLALQREQSRLLGQRGALVAQNAQAKGRQSEIKLRMLELESTRREQAITELRDISVQIAELRERRVALAESLSRTEIRSPQSGVVLDLTVNTVGGVVTPAEPLMYIVPSNENLIVEARIRTTSRDSLQQDQEAIVKFSGLDSAKNPEVRGYVSTIGADAQVDERTGMSFYTVQIKVSDAELEGIVEKFGVELVPGMPAEAYIQTDMRTPMSLILKPFMVYFERAMKGD